MLTSWNYDRKHSGLHKNILFPASNKPDSVSKLPNKDVQPEKHGYLLQQSTFIFPCYLIHAQQWIYAKDFPIKVIYNVRRPTDSYVRSREVLHEPIYQERNPSSSCFPSSRSTFWWSLCGVCLYLMCLCLVSCPQSDLKQCLTNQWARTIFYRCYNLTFYALVLL